MGESACLIFNPIIEFENSSYLRYTLHNWLGNFNVMEYPGRFILIEGKGIEHLKSATVYRQFNPEENLAEARDRRV